MGSFYFIKFYQYLDAGGQKVLDILKNKNTKPYFNNNLK